MTRGITQNIISEKLYPNLDLYCLHFLLLFREMFQIGESKDAEYVDAVKQNILDGSSKWFAKIAITGIENT